MEYQELTHNIIGAAMEVHKTLGNGFQEVIYQRALAIEMADRNIEFSREHEMSIQYKGHDIGTRRVDFFVEDKIMVEIKAIINLEDVHLAQAMNYVEAYNLEIGLLINFGAKSLQFKRVHNNKVLNHDLKGLKDGHDLTYPKKSGNQANQKKIKVQTMSKEMKLIPELRFPEFTDKDEWKLDNVNSLFDLQDGYPFSSKVFTSSPENGRQVIRITDINNQNKNSEKVFIPEEKIEALGIDAYSVREGDLLLSLTGAAGFNFYIWKNGVAFINQRTMKITPKDSKNEFLKVLLGPLIHERINGIGTGQNNNLSKDALKAIEFPVPQPIEQQKIASCLSSLDELIAAHNDKLDALKDHKKGLLQNLFPQEGETLPRLSFSGSIDWMENDLRKVVFFQEGPGIMKVDFHDQGVPLVRLSGVGGPTVTLEGCNYLDPDKVQNKWSHFRLEINDLIISTSATFGLSSTVTDVAAGSIFYTGLIRFRPTDKCIDRNYLKFFLESSPFERQVKLAAVGGGIKHFGPTHLKQMVICYPTELEEQQKIASCLSAVDELITAQQEKIEQLEQHKKGLMQGLFPNPSASSGETIER
jgi:type I restriction enzyme S subunit